MRHCRKNPFPVGSSGILEILFQQAASYMPVEHYLRGIGHGGDPLAGGLDKRAKISEEACFINDGKASRHGGTPDISLLGAFARGYSSVL